MFESFSATVFIMKKSAQLKFGILGIHSFLFISQIFRKQESFFTNQRLKSLRNSNIFIDKGTILKQVYQIV